MNLAELSAAKVDAALVWFLRAATFSIIIIAVALLVNVLRGCP